MISTTREDLLARIGFMQGRLSDPVGGQIQAFPWAEWREEFARAADHGFRIMEWTLDQNRLHDNPLMTEAGRREIAKLKARFGISIPSVTGDCFMQAPFFKENGETRRELLRDLAAVLDACAQIGVGLILVPLVDNGSLENDQQERVLLEGLMAMAPNLQRHGLTIVFESDFEPIRLSRFIASFDSSCFGITYDIGNSASLGYDPAAEVAAYGDRIRNVHVKDRIHGDTTVPLSTGDADLPGAINALCRNGYQGPFILQTARAGDGDHVGAICRYRDMVLTWLSEAAAVS